MSGKHPGRLEPATDTITKSVKDLALIRPPRSSSSTSTTASSIIRRNLSPRFPSPASRRIMFFAKRSVPAPASSAPTPYSGPASTSTSPPSPPRASALPTASAMPSSLPAMAVPMASSSPQIFGDESHPPPGSPHRPPTTPPLHLDESVEASYRML